MAPSVARAEDDPNYFKPTLTNVEDTFKKAFALCALNKDEFKSICDIVVKYSPHITQAKTLGSAGQQEIYFAVKLPDFKTERGQVDAAYWVAASQKRITNDGQTTLGSGTEGADKCGDVDVSVDVGCSGSGNPIYDYLRGIITWMGGLIGLAIVITLIVSGIQYASSAGNAANIAKAKERIFNAVIGLILYLLLGAALRYLIPGIFS